jgi:hypothetical protein
MNTKVKKWLNSKFNDEKEIITSEELNELDEEKEIENLIEEEHEWEEELKEEEERGYNDYNWHEGDYEIKS